MRLNPNDRLRLNSIILDDLFSSNKIAISLLILVIISALCSIWMVHITRGLNTEIGNLIIRNQALNSEYVNLKLEEGTLSNSTRIERIAKKLDFGYVDTKQQILILEH